tara:strand:- start:150 stop:497 length:348 start_codon:yes stop_codon:yes gene_type:complete
MNTITVSGDVNLIAWEGKRISVWESYQVPGQPKPFSRLWMAWFDMSQVEHLQEQDWVEITGELSTKLGKYTPKDGGLEKDVVEHHIQNARLVQVKTKTQQASNAASIDGFDNAPF